MNCELPDVQAGFTKCRGTREQVVSICWIIKKAKEFQKNIYFCFIDSVKAFDCVDHNKLENSSREECQTTWPASWEIWIQVKKQELELDMEQQTGSKLGKEYIKAVSLPCLFNLYAEYIMQNVGVDEVHTRIKIAGRNINNLWYADETTLMVESEELKSLLMKVKEESEKVGLKLDIQKTKIIASGPITSWQVDGETMETLRYFILLGSKITADGDCSYGIKRCLLLGRKTMTNLDRDIKKQRHYFANKGPSSQSYGFSSSHVWMWELDYKESWAPKNWCF